MVHEVHVQGLEVVGTLPRELDGVYIRNGPNPKFPPDGPGNYHWCSLYPALCPKHGIAFLVEMEPQTYVLGYCSWCLPHLTLIIFTTHHQGNSCTALTGHERAAADPSSRHKRHRVVQ